jgi:hypothetical protein
MRTDTSERTVIDIKQIRDMIIRMHDLKKADLAYTVYYDETNNIRRLLNTPNGLNTPDPKCFALGGIAHARTNYDFRLEALRKKLKLQKSTKEMKLEHLAKGDFLRVLDAPKIEIFLNWLIAEGLYVHCAVVDPLYWSIIDIVDSILPVEGNAWLLPAGHGLKSDLYNVLLQDRPGLIEMLYRYSYPNVGKAQQEPFVRELLELAEAREELLPHFQYQMLRGALQMAAKQSALAYLEDEPANVLIDQLSGFFVNRICVLKNAQHIFDQEPWIEKALERMSFRDNGCEVSNFEFVASHDDPGIQLSDVMIGLLGKYFSFLNRMERDELERVRAFFFQSDSAAT